MSYIVTTTRTEHWDFVVEADSEEEARQLVEEDEGDLDPHDGPYNEITEVDTIRKFKPKG